MLERLRGKLIEKTLGKIVVETGGGLGLSLSIPLTTSLALPSLNEEVILETRLILKEESVELFGFLTKLERDSFDILTSVSRIGPKLALTIISAMGPGELAGAIVRQDLDKIAGIKGIGLKTAERLLVELKDKARKLQDAHASSCPAGPLALSGASQDAFAEASGALQSLGHTRQEAEKVLKKVLASLGESPSVEELIREALKSLQP